MALNAPRIKATADSAILDFVIFSIPMVPAGPDPRGIWPLRGVLHKIFDKVAHWAKLQKKTTTAYGITRKDGLILKKFDSRGNQNGN